MYFHLILTVLLCFSLVTQADEQGQSQATPDKNNVNPSHLVTTLSQEFVTVLSRLPRDGKRNKAIKKAVEQILFPHVDTRYVAYSVLGKNLKQTTQEQRDAFTRAFSAHLIDTYTLALSKFDNQSIQVKPYLSSLKDKNKVSIQAVVSGPEQPKVDIAFKLRKNKKTGEWKVYDLVAEGISLLHSKRSEFAKMLKQRKVTGVTEYLNQSR
jgi:phospholipid transport system substrate-binding protein